jgi:ATP-dependent protease ClpP protease subunit
MKQGIFMRAQAEGSKDAIIDVVGVIGWEVWYPAMRDMLRSIPETVDRVIFEIYSPGGDVWEGNAIIQEIGALKQNTVARVQVAASMATLIAVACKEREIAGNGRFLVHNPWAMVQGDADSMEKRAKELRDCEAEAAAFYAARTGQPVEKVRDLMDEERWLTPKEAQEFGFVQKVNDPFDAAAFAGVRSEIEAAGKWPQALVEIQTDTPPPPPAEPEKEKPDGNDKPEGSAPDAGLAPGDAGKPADAPDAAPDAIAAAYERGVADGRAAAESSRSAEIAEFQAGLARRDGLISHHQSRADKAEAAVEAGKRALSAAEASHALKMSEMSEKLKDANERNSKLLRGGMSFEPAGPETWEEAMRACCGDYVQAVRRYPKLRDEFVRKNARK